MSKIYLSHSEVNERAKSLAATIMAGMLWRPTANKPIRLYGVPRGGIPAAYLLARHLPFANVVESPDNADFIIDDLIDSGATQERYKTTNPEQIFFALYKKSDPADWLIFPWEGSEMQSADDVPIRLLQYIGEDPTRGGLQETPARFLKAWNFWTSGYGKDPKEVLKVFEDGAENVDEMVLQKNIPVYSQCEHHLAPFFGVAHIAYIPNGKIVGLSKMSRLVEVFARRLQVQERLTNQIADAIEQHLTPKGVGVVLECRHMCMESRGIQQQGTSTTTSALRGALKENHDSREEFMRLIS